MVVDETTSKRAYALGSVLECREQIRQATAAMWLNAEYARRLGVSLPQIATAAGVTVETLRGKLRAVSGRA
jgi:hypothetical protein